MSRHFDRRRPLALGLGSLGSPLGGFLFAPLFVYTLRELSFQGTLWIFAGLLLQTVVAGMALIPAQEKHQRQDNGERELGNGRTNHETSSDKAIEDGNEIDFGTAGCGGIVNHNGVVEPVGMITPLTIPTMETEVEVDTDLSLPGLFIISDSHGAFSGLGAISMSDPGKKQDSVKEGVHVTREVPGSVGKTSPDVSNLSFSDDSVIDKRGNVNTTMNGRSQYEAVKMVGSRSTSTPTRCCSGFSLPIDMTLFRDPVFLLVSLVFAIGTPTVYSTWTYLPSLAQQLG